MNITFSQLVLAVSVALCFQTSFSQVGIGTTTPRGALDISSTTQGIVPPAVALTNINIQAPVINPQGGVIPAGTFVWNTNTAGSIPTNVSPGLYYWNGTRWISVAGSPGGLDWSIIGNGGIDGGVTGVTGTPATLGANFLGTYDNTNVDIKTNGVPVARFSSLGEFFVGAIETVLPGDLMNAVSEGNALFPWAVNGYTDQNGGGVYGSVTAGATNFGAVQGEYVGTGVRGSGVRGVNLNAISGTNFGSVGSGVIGDATSGGSYKFGVYGTGATSRRSGGVMGYNHGIAYGALGYYANNWNDYAVYGFGQNHTNGGAGGRSSSSEPNTYIGLGIYGGVMGGWIKGSEYGTVLSGERFSSYNMGAVITNDNYVVLSGKEHKTVSYASTALKPEITAKGMGQLQKGFATIHFKKQFVKVLDTNKSIIITCTPMGESNGVFLAEITKDGFRVKENKNGISNVKFTWIAIGERMLNNEVSKELLTAEFEKNMNGVMHNDLEDGGKGIWSQNGEVHFGENAPKNPVRNPDNFRHDPTTHRANPNNLKIKQQ